MAKKKKAGKKSSCCCGSKYTLKPMEDRVVVKRLEAEDKTAGGIILPDAAKEKPQRAEVIWVGEGRLLDSGKRVAPDVASGDIVLFGRYAGTDVKVEGVEYMILRESDILAKL